MVNHPQSAMKTILGLCVCGVLAFTVCPARASSDFLNLEVEIKTENHDAPPNEDRSKWLIVRVTNESAAALEGATLRWKLFRETLEAGPNRIALEKSGEERLSVQGGGQFVDITTAKVEFKWTLPHSIRTGRRYFRRIPESGSRYYGYLVEVVKDGKVIAEAMSNGSLRAWEKSGGSSTSSTTRP